MELRGDIYCAERREENEWNIIIQKKIKQKN